MNLVEAHENNEDSGITVDEEISVRSRDAHFICQANKEN